MKLIELEPRFVRYVVTPNVPTEVAVDPSNYPAGGTKTVLRDQVTYETTTKMRKAQGVQFLCPKCFVANGGKVGTHLILCWSRSRGVPDSAQPGPGRWTLEGTGFDDLTLNGDSPAGPGTGARSVLLTGGGCGWHGFVTKGEVTTA